MTAARFRAEVITDVRIPTGEAGVTLSGDLYRPAGTGPVPALVTVLPYRKDAGAGLANQAALRWFAERGYACLLVDFRGTGSSDGRMRLPFDPGEADDAIAAIEWAAVQPWCDGRVGMWGISYGGVMAMRTASRRPPHLRAIIPIEGMLDPEHDFVHPDPVAGGFGALVWWGASNLTNQLLPPLLNHHSADEQRRWRDRLELDEPYLVELARRQAGDPAWRERVVDARAIAVPTLCVGGWRDLFCAGTLRAYEQIPAAKKLIVGPWMHTMPHESPFAAIDFLPIALRWWDHWLRGVDNGIMDEPPVLLYRQGADPGWSSHAGWPPAKAELVLATGAGPKLSPGPLQGPGTTPVGECPADPTTGPLSGLWSCATTGFGLPVDQHEDDSRAFTVTSEPLAEAVVIAGRPEVTVVLPAEATPASRLVVRLTEVDPAGRSLLICTGLIEPDPTRRHHRVVLWPTVYQVAAGHRIRVVLGEADFPRLRPLDRTPPWPVSGVEVVLPTLDDDPGTREDLPPKREPEERSLLVALRPRWELTRDPLRDGIEVLVGLDTDSVVPARGYELRTRWAFRAAVRRDRPEAATITATDSAEAVLDTGETVKATATVRLTRTALWARGEVEIDGLPVFTRTWQVPRR